MPDPEFDDNVIAELADELKRRLAEIDSLDSENRAAGATVELDQQSVGRLARMDAIERQEMALATRRRREAERRRIQAAFQRLDEGEYGYCVKCGEAIAEARLRLDPSTPQCVDCASG